MDSDVECSYSSFSFENKEVQPIGFFALTSCTYDRSYGHFAVETGFWSVPLLRFSDGLVWTDRNVVVRSLCQKTHPGSFIKAPSNLVQHNGSRLRMTESLFWMNSKSDSITLDLKLKKGVAWSVVIENCVFSLHPIFSSNGKVVPSWTFLLALGTEYSNVFYSYAREWQSAW